MKCLCLTGFGASPKLLHSVLSGAGMTPPLPAALQPPVDIYSWHRQVLKLLEQKEEEAQPADGLGRMWERLASEIFLANEEAPLWGWADEASTELLDFWRGFDRRLNFVLLFIGAEEAVAAYIEQAEPRELTLEQVLDAWRQRHEALLRFGLRYPKRCLMLDAEEALAQPEVVAEQLNTKWRLPLDASRCQPTSPTASPMARFLAGQLLRDYPEIEALQREITASVTRLSAAPAGTSFTPARAELIDSYRSLLDRSQEQNQIQLLQEQCARLDQLYQRTLGNYQQQYQEFQARNRESGEQMRALRGQLAEAHELLGSTAAQFEAELSQAREAAKRQERDLQILEGKLGGGVEENELILLQLTQVQEELELAVTQREELKKTGAEKKRALEAHQAKLAQALKQGDDLQKQLAQIINIRDERSKVADASQQKLTQVELDKKKLESEIKKYKDSEAHHAQAIKTLGHKVKEGEEENELLLMQMHQVQEELEHYFLNNRELRGENAELDARLRKMQEHYPGYVEFGAVEVLEAAPQRATWRLNDLALAGQSFKELRFTTVIEHGMAGFVFSREVPVSQHFFKRWPVDQAELMLLPLGTPAQVKERSVALLALGTGEWTRLLALSDFLIMLLEKQPHALKAPIDFRANEWLDGLRTLKTDLVQFPAVLRFDQLKLKREQVNPDYEHLWLAFENLSVGERSIPRFEFRLSCAEVRPGFFGKFPKLEFPDSDGKALFDSWFEESYDDFGSKLELRYALPESMDLGIWNKLSGQDQKTLRMLIKNLPGWLLYMEKGGNRLTRPWQDWQTMVVEVQRITTRHASDQKQPQLSPVPVALGATQAEDKIVTLSPASGTSVKKSVSKRKASAASTPATTRKKKVK
jgi:hypothetical protein